MFAYDIIIFVVLLIVINIIIQRLILNHMFGISKRASYIISAALWAVIAIWLYINPMLFRPIPNYTGSPYVDAQKLCERIEEYSYVYDEPKYVCFEIAAKEIEQKYIESGYGLNALMSTMKEFTDNYWNDASGGY